MKIHGLLSMIMMFGTLTSAAVYAEGHEGLRKETPGQLGLYVVSDASCPFKMGQLEDLANARLSAMHLVGKSFQADEVYLRVIVSCLRSEYGGGYIYNGQLDFVVAQETGVMRPWQGIYGVFGVGDSDRILSVVGDSLGAAIQDYVDSNPGLASESRMPQAN
jgi:hypothetical protein